MPYYIEIDGKEHEFAFTWQLFDFMSANGLKKMHVFYTMENGKTRQFNVADNGEDKVYPIYDDFGQQVLDKNRQPIKRLVERWQMFPLT